MSEPIWWSGCRSGSARPTTSSTRYMRAPSPTAYINLTFFSALTLEKPKPSNLLERRFISPVIDRLFGGYPDLAYADALHAGELPPNVQVIEFFFLAGKWLHVPFAQQHYISANYTHASSYLLARGLNVVTQLVAKRVVDGVARYSLSCNTDTTLDVLRARAEGTRGVQTGRPGQFRTAVHAGRGRSAGRRIQRGARGARDSNFRCSRRRPSRSPTPNTPSAFMPRAWCATAARLQIGIGQVGDALAQGLIVRHRDNAQFHAIMKRLTPAAELSADAANRIVRKRPLRRQRNAVRGVSRPDRCRHPQARGRWRRAARRVLPRAEIVLSRAARDDAGPDRADPDDAGVLHQRALWRRGRQSGAPASMPALSTMR